MGGEGQSRKLKGFFQSTLEVTIFSDRIVTSSKHKISVDIGPKINSSRISNLEILLLDQFFLFDAPSPGKCSKHDSCARIFHEIHAKFKT